MDDLPRKFVLVVGTGWANRAKQRAARMIGTLLADAGFGLVAGDSTGVDYRVSEAYCATRRERGEALAGAFWQIALGGLRFFRRGGLPLPGYPAPPDCRVRTRDVEAWKREAVGRCDAAVMIGGGGGALDIARRILERDRPVFPLPFLGGLTGNSDFVFQEILRTWEGHPVPGVSRTQFLRLAEPWVSGTGALGNLLLGTLAEVPDLFISYRRSDAPAAAGRLAADLAEHFGSRRVFLDIQGIAPSRAWDTTLDEAIASCRAGLVVIGRQWLAAGSSGEARLQQPEDIVRREVTQLLAQRKAVFPLLVEGARLPEVAELPAEMAALLRFQALSLDNASWPGTLAQLILQIDALLRHLPRAH